MQCRGGASGNAVKNESHAAPAACLDSACPCGPDGALTAPAPVRARRTAPTAPAPWPGGGLDSITNGGKCEASLATGALVARVGY